MLRLASNTRSTLSLSSGEAECYGVVKAAAVGLGVQAFFKDCALSPEVELQTDSTAGKAIASRRGH